MRKTEVYSWRISSEVKSALEEEARAEGLSMARLLDRIVQAWLEHGSAEGDEKAVQRRLHKAAEKTIGTIRGGDPHRAEQAHDRLREKLRRRHASSRAD
jgi:hypothetical protein